MIGCTDKEVPGVRAVLVGRHSVDRVVLAISPPQGRAVLADLAVPLDQVVVLVAAPADASQVVAVVFLAVDAVDHAQAPRTAAAPLEMPAGAAGSTTATSR
jgi:hypothetical protein